MDQKQNPTAVVNTLNCLVRLMKQNADTKFMIKQKSVYPSDDEDLLTFGPGVGRVQQPMNCKIGTPRHSKFYFFSK